MKFKIRCIAIGQIMTSPRAIKDRNAGNLSATTKTYIESWVKEKMFDRKKQFSNKYTEKGIEVEDESIDFLVQNNFLELASKNEKFFENDFLTGTPDIIQPSEIIDVKNSWELFTFPLFETGNTNKGYDWQLQGYMSLTGKQSARLIYLLIDAPEILIEKEVYFATNNKELLQSEYEEIEKGIYKNLTFGDILPKHRVKIFEIKRDEEKIEMIKNRVAQCQAYVDELVIKLNQ